jgi:hypothetical protein
MQIYIQNNENKIKIIFPINILRVQNNNIYYFNSLHNKVFALNKN